MQKPFLLTTFAAAVFSLSMAASANGLPRNTAPADAEVYIVTPQDGAVVDKTFTVKFGLKNMEVSPAGIDKPGTGHHHLLIDTVETDLPDMNFILPTTDKVRHFGKGEMESQLTLAPGQHTLQLLMGDRLHIPHTAPVLSKKITITVK
jgi:hypothetical protein